MTSSKQFRNVKNKFVVSIVALAVLSVLSLGVVLYEASTISFGDNVSSSDLHSLVEESPDVATYLTQQKDYEAHFITIANMVQQEKQDDITRALVMVLIPIIVIVGVAGYLIANYLLRPVKESYESQERFMQDASHELRNPLAAISVALENAPKDQADTNLVKTLRRQTKRLVSIVEDMLFLERRNAGDPVAEINISNLLLDVVEDMTPLMKSKSLIISSKIQPDISFKIDPQDFIKLSRNLLENAIKYSNAGKKISIILEKKSKIELTIKDRGIGIPAAELDKIGNRFYRAKNVGKVSGTGLGVAIVNKVLNAYGGNLDITSKINNGTTVKVTL